MSELQVLHDEIHALRAELNRIRARIEKGRPSAESARDDDVAYYNRQAEKIAQAWTRYFLAMSAEVRKRAETWAVVQPRPGSLDLRNSGHDTARYLRTIVEKIIQFNLEAELLGVDVKFLE